MIMYCEDKIVKGKLNIEIDGFIYRIKIPTIISRNGGAGGVKIKIPEQIKYLSEAKSGGFENGKNSKIIDVSVGSG